MPVTIRRKGVPAEGTLALRLAPKTKFAIELLARKQGTTLSAIVASAVEKPLRERGSGLTVAKPGGKPRGEEVYLPDVIWDPLFPDRLVKLAIYAPDLLTDREAVIWKVVQADRTFWRDTEPAFETIRERWAEIENLADSHLAKFGK